MSDSPTAAAIVVIGYGNELRGDDAIGPYLAAAVEARGWPHVRTLTVQQLMPEMAEVLAGARLAIFIDACAGLAGEPVQVCRIEPGGSAGATVHSGDPRVLLGLARDLFGKIPAAWWVLVAGSRFGLGEGLSAEALALSRTALERIEILVRCGSDLVPAG